MGNDRDDENEQPNQLPLLPPKGRSAVKKLGAEYRRIAGHLFSARLGIFNGARLEPVGRRRHVKLAAHFRRYIAFIIPAAVAELQAVRGFMESKTHKFYADELNPHLHVVDYGVRVSPNVLDFLREHVEELLDLECGAELDELDEVYDLMTDRIRSEAVDGPWLDQMGKRIRRVCMEMESHLMAFPWHKKDVNTVCLLIGKAKGQFEQRARELALKARTRQGRPPLNPEDREARYKFVEDFQKERKLLRRTLEDFCRTRGIDKKEGTRICNWVCKNSRDPY